MARCKSLFAGLPGSKATRQGFTRFSGSSKLAFGRLQNPFRGARPQNLHMHMATRLQGSPRPPGKVLWAFEACVWPASKPFSRGPASKPLRAHGYKGLSATRLRPPGKVLWAFDTCVWPASKPFSRGPASKPSHAHGYKGVSGHQARFYGPSKLAFGRLQNPFRGVPASKPSPPHGHQARF